MSYLDKKLQSFQSSVAAASTKIANKRDVSGSYKPTPSPAPAQTTAASSKNDLKRKRPESSQEVWSQPAQTGTGQEISTQILYAVNYLKDKGTPQKLSDLLSYLSLQHQKDQYKRTVESILKEHEKVEYDPTGFNGKGSFSFRPIHNIRSGEQLLGYLQSQTTAQGLSVRELRDGWPGAEDAIMELEKEGKLLVIKNNKDQRARFVWLNDPTLRVTMDKEFKDIWDSIRLPEAGALADELERAGLVPTNKSRGVKVKSTMKEKPKKRPRKTGKTTNVHMIGVLRDYSSVRK
jgi:transcription initiation factor TFIIE subunit beta